MNSPFGQAGASVASLHKAFFPGTVQEKRALNGVDFSLSSGEFSIVIGSNGAGKSTMLDAISGELTIDKGMISIEGSRVEGLPAHKRARFISRVFQDPMLGTAASLTIEENLAISMLRGKRRSFRFGLTSVERDRFRTALESLGLGLENRLQDRVALLSGGQRQSLTLVMATLDAPQLLLLDEHTAALVDCLQQKSLFWGFPFGFFVRLFWMRTGIFFTVSSADRKRPLRIICDPKSPQKHVWRARMIVASDDGLGTHAIMATTGKSKTCVWRWQKRFMDEGVDGLLHDATRPPGTPPVAPDRVDEIIALTLKPPPHEATHWTVRAMAKVAGVAASTVHTIWRTHGLTPHRFRQFKLSNDPAFASKLHDIVGLHVSPPAHAVVLSIDEKSQIQALDRTQPGLPLKKGRGATMTHDYKRNGTTTLFAALNVLDGTVIG